MFALRAACGVGGVEAGGAGEQGGLCSTPPSSPARKRILSLEVPSAPPSGEGMILDPVWLPSSPHTWERWGAITRPIE